MFAHVKGCDVKWHKEWRGHSYALNLRGARRKMEPPYSNKNAPRQGVCIA